MPWTRPTRTTLSNCGMIAAALLLIPATYAQQPPPTPELRLVDALQRVDKDDLGYGSVDLSCYLDIIAHAHAVEAIPAIERLFPHHTRPLEQLVIASVLIRLGDTNPIFWNLLVAKATEALDINPPFPYASNPTPEQPFAAEFVAWAKARNLSLQDADEQATFDIPQALALLAQAGDPRGLPLLRRALHSDNLLFQVIAAAGLGKLNDQDSIPFLLESCAKQQPQSSPLGRMMADSLLYFNDPRADQGFKQYFPDIDFAQAKRFRSSDNYAPEPTSPAPRPLPDPPTPVP